MSMRLNRYIAQAGICSRRNAIELIKQGKVTVNNKKIVEPGYEVKPDDVVRYKKRIIKPTQYVYILLNKPKGYITTTADEYGRKNVIDLIKKATKERVFPVGRLDKDTTGLLLITNDGDLALTLSHPRYKVKKKYYVILNKKFEQDDFAKLKKGIRLYDGFIKPDGLSYGKRKNELFITLHSGKKRIIRRMLEHFEYKIKKLDRIIYAGLEKKDLRVGCWRFLSKREIEKLTK